MPKISAVMNVYNEELLLPHVLANIQEYVDEIVIVDGSPVGPSSDSTREIAEAHEKVIYKSGTFDMMDGGWDMAKQRNTGIASATGDTLMLLSADMLFTNLQVLRDAVDLGLYKIYFCPVVEFWLDSKQQRLYSGESDPLTVQAPILEPIAIDRDLNPYCETDGKLNLEGATIRHRVVLSQTTKFHLGWLRPFSQQVAKHIRHVKQHRWGDHGERLLRGAERGLEQWAILHVLGYNSIPAISYMGILPEEMNGLKDMRYDDGAQEMTDDFESRHKVSIFKLMRGRDAVQ